MHSYIDRHDEVKFVRKFDPRTGIIADRGAVAVLVAVAVLALLTFRDYGLGWDDYTHAQYGELLLAFFTSGFSDRRAFSFVNLYYYGGGFDMAAAILAKILPFDLFETRRLAGAMVGITGLAVVWRTARRLGGPIAGFLALLLLVTCPVYYGEMFINSKDGPFAVAMALAVFALVRAFAEYPRPSLVTVAMLGLGVGLAIGTRIMGVFLGLYAVSGFTLLVLLSIWSDGVRAAATQAGTFLIRAASAVVLAYGAIALVWPWAVVDANNPIRAVSYFGVFFEKPWREIFDGMALQVHQMPRSYLPTLLTLKLSEGLVVLGAIGVLGSLAALLRQRFDPRHRAGLFVVVLAFALPFAITVITRPAMYNGIRHFVFLIPPIAILAGLAAGWVLERAWRIGHMALAFSFAAFAASLALPAIEMARLHPYEYSYFNGFSGGVAGAQSRYMLDYWGLAFKQAGRALRDIVDARGETPPAGRPWAVAVCGPHPPAQVALGEQYRPTWEPRGADFALMLGVYYCAKLDAPLLAEITREGVTYARVYDLRGRTVTNLFTVRPVTRD